MLAPGALRLLYLQLYVDDGGYLQSVGRARAATDGLSASMRRQAGIMSQYRRDVALTAGAGALALGAMVTQYARVEEAAARTVFATNDMRKITEGFHASIRGAVRDSIHLSAQMGVTLQRAQNVNLAIEEAGLKNSDAINAMAQSSIALSRATGGLVSDTEAFDATYRLLRITLREGEDINDTAKAAMFYASAIALAGNESAAGITPVLAYLNTLKDIELAVPLAREELIALAASMADVNDRTKEMSRTAIIRLFTKGATANFGRLSAAVLRHASPDVLAREGVSTSADLDRLRREKPVEFLFAIASAAKQLSRDIGPTGEILSASVQDVQALKDELGLTNTRDIVALAQISAAMTKYRDITALTSEELERYLANGADATSLSKFHSAWLTTLTGQWEQFKSAMSRANAELNMTLSIFTALPATGIIGLMNGLAASPGLLGVAAIGGGLYLRRRLQNIRMLRDMKLDALLYAPERTGTAVAREMAKQQGIASTMGAMRDPRLLPNRKRLSAAERAAVATSVHQGRRLPSAERYLAQRHLMEAKTMAPSAYDALMWSTFMGGKTNLMDLQRNYAHEQASMKGARDAAVASAQRRFTTASARERAMLAAMGSTTLFGGFNQPRRMPKSHATASGIQGLAPSGLALGTTFGAVESPAARARISRAERLAGSRTGFLGDLLFAAGSGLDLLSMGRTRLPGMGRLGRVGAFMRARSALANTAFATTRTAARKAGASALFTRFAPKGAAAMARFGLGGMAGRMGLGALAGIGAIPVIGTFIAGLALLAPVFRGMANSMTDMIKAGGPLAGVLRVVRFVFRTLELGGAAISAVFNLIWKPIKWVLSGLGMKFTEGTNFLDAIDEGMKGASERLRPSAPKPKDTSTEAERRAATHSGDTYNITLNSTGRDGQLSALRDARMLPAGVSRNNITVT